MGAQLLLQPRRAVAIAAGPGLSAIEIAAVALVMRTHGGRVARRGLPADPDPRATGHERALCICGFRGRVFLNNAQLYLPGCNHVAEQFGPFGTFEDTGYRHW